MATEVFNTPDLISSVAAALAAAPPPTPAPPYLALVKTWGKVPTQAEDARTYLQTAVKMAMTKNQLRPLQQWAEQYTGNHFQQLMKRASTSDEALAVIRQVPTYQRALDAICTSDLEMIFRNDKNTHISIYVPSDRMIQCFPDSLRDWGMTSDDVVSFSVLDVREFPEDHDLVASITPSLKAGEHYLETATRDVMIIDHERWVSSPTMLPIGKLFKVYQEVKVANQLLELPRNRVVVVGLCMGTESAVV